MNIVRLGYLANSSSAKPVRRESHTRAYTLIFAFTPPLSTDEISTVLYIQGVRMSIFIRISEETKQKLEAVKRDDETFGELLDRLAVTRALDDVQAMAGFAEEGIEERMKKTHGELSESLEENSRR